ncbi:hypothetical protein LOAG_10247, partial [Loa loa]
RGQPRGAIPFSPEWQSKVNPFYKYLYNPHPPPPALPLAGHTRVLPTYLSTYPSSISSSHHVTPPDLLSLSSLSEHFLLFLFLFLPPPPPPPSSFFPSFTSLSSQPRLVIMFGPGKKGREMGGWMERKHSSCLTFISSPSPPYDRLLLSEPKSIISPGIRQSQLRYQKKTPSLPFPPTSSQPPTILRGSVSGCTTRLHRSENCA